jgi:nucleoid-associated protein YgaU
LRVNDGSVRRRGLVAAGGLAVGYLVVTVTLTWGTSGALAAVRGPGPAGPGAAVALAAAAGAWAALTWLTAVTLAAVTTAAVAGLGSRAHRRAVALAPAAARRLVAGLLGLTIAGAPLAAAVPAGAAVVVAVAATDHPDHTDRADLTGADRDALLVPDRPAALVPTGWTPDRPVSTNRRSAGDEAAVRLVAGRPRAERRVVDEVVVRRGDTLWDIAARYLGPDASAAEVAGEWPRWYRANRAVIGADPDLLIPGERLVPPPGG